MTDIEWRVEPLPKRGYARRPHAYVNGSQVSFCLLGHRRKGDLAFDISTGESSRDPRLDGPQFRRACGTCVHDLEATYGPNLDSTSPPSSVRL